jgi:hypothetical protein
VLQTLARLAPAAIVTDGHPAYPALAQRYLPRTRHEITKPAKNPFRPEGSRRNVDDALFALNHTASKLRHDLARLLRKVWVTTKKASRLQDHLDLYTTYHNGYRLVC